MTPEINAQISSGLHWGVGTLLSIAFLCFLFQFVVPSFRVGRELQRARKRLEDLKAKGQVLDLDRVRSEAMVSESLRHCWDEYRDTLHGQKQVNASGMLEVSRWRATSMANAFFTDQGLIEAPLRTEFYKHLPGILTGLGIIGTFSGLIIGLQGFKVSDDAQVVRVSLETLIVSVGGAFLVSGIAIALAMFVTTVEKLIINSRYTALERLCSVVDSLFDAGAGEEYLQRLVEASETSATQAMQMKESLVTDLKQVLTELTQQQIATMTATSAQLGQSIATSLTEGLADPLTRISHAVQAVGNSQGEAVNKLLTDVLGGFTAQMENMFGSQMRGMNEMLVETANTIQTASKQFEFLASQIQQAGSGAADAMAKRMDEALQQMQARQAESNEQMQLFIAQLKENVARGQSDSAELTLGMMRELSETTGELVKGLQQQAQAAQRDHSSLQAETNTGLQRFLEQMQAASAKGQSESAEATRLLMGQLGDSAGGLVKSLQDQAQRAQDDHASRQAELTSKTADLMEQQSQQVARLTEAVQQASAAMQSAVDRLQAKAQVSIESMGLGAERLLGASTRLGDNLELMKTNSDGLGSMAEKLASSSGTLSNALVATQQVLGDQKAVRDALSGLVTDLRATIENAKREASLTSSLVDSLEAASHRLTEAQRTTETYLAGVTDVLGEAHGTFTQQMMTTMREGNKAFHEELAQATGLLKNAIQELGDVLDNLPSAA
ncbi:MAG: anti-phage ZorAB system protein ZorA [Pseudomonadota bacterium]